MGSHSVTCHPTEVILTPLPRHTAVLINRPRKDERLSWPIGGWLHQFGLPVKGHLSKY